MTEKNEKIEESGIFTPKFDEKGLIPCITADAGTGAVLMMAWMNEKALRLTLKTGEAHYWSRSRQELWRKGATSGAVQRVKDIRTDCDQDCLLMFVEIEDQESATCHTGRPSCFYRILNMQDDAKTIHLRFI